ncbi:hypothetical protein GCM10009810_02710 [Nostocoides vanveenii]|uniref:Secreted protein n=1 Tax=Nostocoides vanveenii TaxID=330835 RepID=A0ABP4W2Y0_9MICO
MARVPLAGVAVVVVTAGWLIGSLLGRNRKPARGAWACENGRKAEAQRYGAPTQGVKPTASGKRHGTQTDHPAPVRSGSVDATHPKAPKIPPPGHNALGSRLLARVEGC